MRAEKIIPVLRVYRYLHGIPEFFVPWGIPLFLEAGLAELVGLAGLAGLHSNMPNSIVYGNWI